MWVSETALTSQQTISEQFEEQTPRNNEEQETTYVSTA